MQKRGVRAIGKLYQHKILATVLAVLAVLICGAGLYSCGMWTWDYGIPLATRVKDDAIERWDQVKNSVGQWWNGENSGKKKAAGGSSKGEDGGGASAEGKRGGGIPNGKKEVTLYLDANDKPTTSALAVRTERLFVPLGVSNSAAALFASEKVPEYSAFLEKFGVQAAETMLSIPKTSVAVYTKLTPAQAKEFWRQVDPKDPLWPPALVPALEYLRQHKMTPDEIILYSELEKGDGKASAK
jgi:hypothetical protein